MKKKIISLVMALVIMIGIIPTTVFADSRAAESKFSFETNKETVHVGEEFTVTIKLDEAITKAEDVTNLQCELYYENTVMKYVSHELFVEKESVKLYGVGFVPKKNCFAFSRTDMESNPFEVSAGKMMAVTLKATEDLTSKKIETALSLKSALTTAGGTTTKAESLINIDITAHNMAEATCTNPKKCTLCSKTEGEALGHAWNAGVVTTVPSNGKEGVKTYTCTSCGATKTEKYVEIPQPVKNLTAVSAGKNKVKLTWSAASGAEGYLIYGQKDGKYGYVGMTTKGVTFTDKNALDTDYNFYWVFPYVKDATGKMLPGGCTKYVYAKGVCPAVTGLKAASVKGGVKLTWNTVADAEGYLVYGIENNGKYGYVGMTTRGTTVTAKNASKTVYNYYWVFPYYKNADGKMVVGGTAPYTYGRAK